MSIFNDDTLVPSADALAELRAQRDFTLDDVTEADGEDDDPLAGHPDLVRLGHYVLLAKLGQGGMGVVHAAYDERLDRKVALKLLRVGDDRRARKRLVREAKSMARLSHPNVVQIYEIGESEGLIYIVMEFVNGLTLRHWRTEARRSQADILEVFVAAGQGLMAAHAQGLVHRDFKPDNVMIRDDGRVLVMDFGLAHVEAMATESIELSADSDQARVLIEPSGLTATGALMGTPAYMAPEQFEGRETDPRTDQFSFCVALWEALHGQRPFEGTSLMDLSVAVCSGSVISPDTGGVPGWLRRVLERGLAVEPDDRWPSLADLLDALRRDPTRRRRGLGMSFAGLLAVGLVAGGLAVGRERSEAKRVAACASESDALRWTETVEAGLREAFTATELGYADTAWTRTQAILDAYADSWRETRTRICVERPETEAVMLACLDERRAAFEGLVAAWTEVDDKSLSRAIHAAASLPPLTTCTSEAQLDHHMAPPEALASDVADVRGQLEQIKSLSYAGKWAEGLDQADALEARVESIGWRPLAAELELSQALLHGRLGEYEPARALATQAYLDAVGVGHDLAALDAATALSAIVGDKLAQPELGLFWAQLAREYIARLELDGSLRAAAVDVSAGAVHDRAGDYEAGRAAHERALAIAEDQLGHAHPEVAIGLKNIGTAHWEQSHYPEALDYFERSLALERELLGESHPNIATTINNIGAVYWRSGEYADALAQFREALAIREAALAPSHPDVAAALNNVGAAEASLGHGREALVAFRRALELQEDQLGPEHPDVAGYLTNIANMLREQGEVEEALAHHRRALAIWETALGPEHPRVAMALNNIGSGQWFSGDYAACLDSHRRALEIRETALGPESPEVAASLENLGLCLVGLGRYDEAIEAYTRGQTIRAAAFEPDSVELAVSHTRLGDVYARMDRLDESVAQFRQALALYEAKLEPDHIDIGQALVGLGDALNRGGAFDQARPLLERGLAIYAAGEPDLVSLGDARFALATALAQTGEAERARELATAAREVLVEAEAKGIACAESLAQVDAWLAARP